MYAAFALSLNSVQALDILHIANADSTDYKTFIQTRYPGVNWVHKNSGLTASETVGGNLDALRDYTGIHGGTQISARTYMQGFDLVIVDSDGVTSTNFVDTASAGAKWAAVTKPILFHSSLIARATGSRPGMFSGDNNTTITYANPNDTLRISATPLSDAIFTGVTTVTDLFSGTNTETVLAAASFGGGELITSLTDGVTLTPPRGIVFWNAGVTNGAGNLLAAKRGFLPLRNSTVTSSAELTADGMAMAQCLADFYHSTEWKGVFCSPLRRAILTATPLCQKLGIEPELRPDLREIGYGKWEGQGVESVNRDFHDEYIRWSADR